MTFGSGAYGCLGHGNCNDVSQVCLLVTLSLCLCVTLSLCFCVTLSVCLHVTLSLCLCVCVFGQHCLLVAYVFVVLFIFVICLYCFDAVGWVAGRASGL